MLNANQHPITDHPPQNGFTVTAGVRLLESIFHERKTGFVVSASASFRNVSITSWTTKATQNSSGTRTIGSLLACLAIRAKATSKTESELEQWGNEDQFPKQRKRESGKAIHGEDQSRMSLSQSLLSRCLILLTTCPKPANNAGAKCAESLGMRTY